MRARLVPRPAGRRLRRDVPPRRPQRRRRPRPPRAVDPPRHVPRQRHDGQQRDWHDPAHPRDWRHRQEAQGRLLPHGCGAGCRQECALVPLTHSPEAHTNLPDDSPPHAQSPSTSTTSTSTSCPSRRTSSTAPRASAPCTSGAARASASSPSCRAEVRSADSAVGRSRRRSSSGSERRAGWPRRRWRCVFSLSSPRPFLSSSLESNAWWRRGRGQRGRHLSYLRRSPVPLPALTRGEGTSQGAQGRAPRWPGRASRPGRSLSPGAGEALSLVQGF